MTGISHAPSSRSRNVVRAMGACAMLLLGGTAHADEPSAPAPVARGDPTAFFRYKTPAGKYYFRAALEEVGMLGLGFAQYLANAGANTRDWDLGYDWDSFRSKLTGESISFDTNHFDTNHLTHPAAGLFYYLVARGNRLSQLESFLFTTAASTLWEYVGELREKTSINDLVFTPVSGMALGESTTQIGGFFHRGKRNATNAVLGFLFAPSKTLHDLVDDVTPETAPELDRFGFPKDVSHDIRVGIGGSVTAQAVEGSGRRVYSDATTSIFARVVNLPDYDRAGVRSLGFFEANVAQLEFSTQQSGDRFADLSLRAHVMPAGYLDRSVRELGGRLQGTQLLVGLDVGYEYDLHDYERTKLGWMDRVSLVTSGVSAEHTAYFDRTTVRTRLDALGTFGGVGAFALDKYEIDRPISALQSVLAGEGYYYTGGPALAWSVAVGHRGIEIGGQARVDSFTQIEGFDRLQSRFVRDVPASDKRVFARGWLSVTLPGDVVRVTIWARHLQREGTIEDVSVIRAEGSGGGHLELVF